MAKNDAIDHTNVVNILLLKVCSTPSNLLKNTNAKAHGDILENRAFKHGDILTAWSITNIFFIHVGNN